MDCAGCLGDDGFGDFLAGPTADFSAWGVRGEAPALSADLSTWVLPAEETGFLVSTAGGRGVVVLVVDFTGASLLALLGVFGCPLTLLSPSAFASEGKGDSSGKGSSLDSSGLVG